MAERILIVYHKWDTLNLLKRLITEKTQYKVGVTDDPLQATTLIRNKSFDLIITGLKMPGKSGIELFEHIKGIDENIPVIIITAYGTIESVVEAMRKGAYDYITKPLKDEHILITIDKAIKWLRLRRENIYLRKTLDDRVQFHNIIGSIDLFSKPFKEAKEKLISDFHARYIKNALSKYGGNVSKAAKACGLKRQYFHRLMREAHIQSASYKKDIS